MSYNPYSLEGKTILITGASSGIGRATAIECSRMGAKCVITGRNEERLNDTFEHLEGEGHMLYVADLTNQADIDLLVDAIPNLDGLVNNAGVGKGSPISFYNEKDLESVFKTNVFAPMLITKALLRKKKMNKYSSIVFTSSIAAYESNVGNGIYGASKAAITRYMHYCVNELTPKLIRVNSVHPGMVDTPFIHGGRLSEEDLEKDALNYFNKRYGKPEEISWAIIYLLSDAAAWITGTELRIDGGRIN